jgi:hypothetical protein
MRLLCIAPFLAATSAAAWIAVTSPALADTGTHQLSSSSVGTDSESQSPGQVGQQYPYGYPYADRVYLGH